MPTVKNVSSETRWLERPGAERVNARIAVTIEWEENGKKFRKEGYTLDVSLHGCLLVVAQNLAVKQRLRLTNLVNNESVGATVVWKGLERPEGWECRLQLPDPGSKFWGIEF